VPFGDVAPKQCIDFFIKILECTFRHILAQILPEIIETCPLLRVSYNKIATAVLFC